MNGQTLCIEAISLSERVLYDLNSLIIEWLEQDKTIFTHLYVIAIDLFDLIAFRLV